MLRLRVGQETMFDTPEQRSSLVERAPSRRATPMTAVTGKPRCRMIAGAVEIHDKAPDRLRLKVTSEGWSGYLGLKDVKHQPKVVGPMAAHGHLPWIHRVFGNAKRWAMGVYHGLREPQLQRYLDEFVLRFNRRTLHKPPSPHSSASPSDADLHPA